MHYPPIPADEAQRLRALAEYVPGDPGFGPEFDELVKLTARFFAVPIALVSLVEETQQVFKSRVGLDVCGTDRAVSFCAHALQLPDPDILLIPDASADPRFAANPLVTGAPHIRFYAGVPLRAPSAHVVGTLCIIDTKPRDGLTLREVADLRTLAGLVVDKLELRRLSVARAEGQSRFEGIASTSPDGILCADKDGLITFWNGAADRLFGWSMAEAIGQPLEIIVPLAFREAHREGFKRVVGGGAPKLVNKTLELQAVRKDGSVFPIELSLSMWDSEGIPSFGGIVRDITERRANEKRLFALAHVDSLTRLGNRTVLLDKVVQAVRAGAPAALLMIDLDGFKNVNDTLGHSAGDRVLCEIANRFVGCLTSADTIARLGGDEFAVLSMVSGQADDATRLANRLIKALAAPIQLGETALWVGASIGIALFPQDGAHAEDLLAAADLAMYQAKGEGRNCMRFFTQSLRQAALTRVAYEGEIRGAMARDEFELFYQPQVRVHDGQIIGVEALLRWRHPRDGLVSPGRFLAAIESGLLAADFGTWTLERACRDIARLRQAEPDLAVGINLFGAQFRTGSLSDDVLDALARHRLPPQALELEITENIIMRHDELMLAPLRTLHQLGVGIAFDDFGTGFASLSLLKRYPLSRIKIDQGFVRDICKNTADAAIVNAITYLARSLGVQIVAEGVETEAQRDFLRACGCGVVQGFLYGRPMPVDALFQQLGRRLEAAA